MAQDEKTPKGEDTIDENLKRVYQDVLEQKVPDRFLSLLDQLKAQDEVKSDPGSGPKK